MALYDMYKGCCSYPPAIIETKTHWPFQQSRKLRTLTSILPPPFSPPPRPRTYSLVERNQLKEFDMLASYNFLHLIFYRFFYCHGN